jgi:tetratricopeptide (TPR) repeat protein
MAIRKTLHANLIAVVVTILLAAGCGPAPETFLIRPSPNMTQEQYAHAVRIYTGIIDQRPDVPALYLSRGYALAKLGNLDDALRDYGRAIDLEPDAAAPYLSRGLLYQKTGATKKALDDFNQAIKLDPLSAQGYNDRGALFIELREWDKALSDLERAIALDPELPEPHNNMGLAYLGAGNSAQAIESFSAAIARCPDCAESYHRRGVLYLQAREFDRAVADFDQAVRIDPIKPIFYEHLGDAHLASEQYYHAIIDFSQVLAFQPGNAHARYGRALACYRIGELRPALQEISLFVESEPANPSGYRLRGAIFAALGRSQQAIADLETYLMLAPDAADSEEVRKTINQYWNRQQGWLNRLPATAVAAMAGYGYLAQYGAGGLQGIPPAPQP